MKKYQIERWGLYVGNSFNFNPEHYDHIRFESLEDAKKYLEVTCSYSPSYSEILWEKIGEGEYLGLYTCDGRYHFVKVVRWYDNYIRGTYTELTNNLG